MHAPLQKCSARKEKVDLLQEVDWMNTKYRLEKKKNKDLILAKKLPNGRGATGWKVGIVAAGPSLARKALGVSPPGPLTSDPCRGRTQGSTRPW